MANLTTIIKYSTELEMNPVRAKMVAHPGGYQWSSYGSNAQGDALPLIRPRPVYGGLTNEDRQAAYRELFRYELDPGLVDEVCQVTHGDLMLGSEHFAEEVAALAGRRTRRGKVGRPRKLSPALINQASSLNLA